MASKLASVFLAVAVLAMFAAWQMQNSAATALATAKRIQGLEVPDGGAEAASVDDYREIVESLDRSISIRTEIDGLLGEVEGIVQDLNQTQAQAVSVAGETQREVASIGRILDGSIDASRDAIVGLDALRGRLARSSELGRLIANELEELDESLGPTLVLP